MRNFIFLSLFASMSVASQITLKQLEKGAENVHPMYLSVKEQKALNNAKMRGEYVSTPFVLSAFAAQAKPDRGNEEFEYSVGVDKIFFLGDQQAKKIEIAKLHHEALSLELEKELLLFSNRIKLFYHQSCLNRDQREAFEKLYSDFQKLYIKKLKAYKYHEISKKELLQLKIEKESLRQKFQSLKSDEEISKISLFDLVALKNEKMELSCQDLYSMDFKLHDSVMKYGLSIESIDRKILGAKKSATLYDRNFESINLSLGYDNEIDTQKYGVGFSLPLSFSSKSSEYKKISALHQQTLLKLQKQTMLLEKKREFKFLEAKLDNEKNLITQADQNIDTYEHDLLPLIQKSYQLGESSVVEYLLSRQKLWQMYEALGKYKKIYYKTLFELYTVLEIKEKK